MKVMDSTLDGTWGKDGSVKAVVTGKSVTFQPKGFQAIIERTGESEWTLRGYSDGRTRTAILRDERTLEWSNGAVWSLIESGEETRQKEAALKRQRDQARQAHQTVRQQERAQKEQARQAREQARLAAIPANAKSAMCTFFLSGHCPRGDRCTYAHDQSELIASCKTAICKFWLQGCCPRGVQCTFAHGEQELAADLAPGDWHCKKCGYLNCCKNDTCRKCG